MNLPSEYQSYIHTSRYAKWIPEENRRETWDETVSRYMNFFKEKFPEQLNEEISGELEDAILNLDTMPSMRTLMTAGKALERDNVAGYNPVSGDTRVVTKELGNVSIKDLNGEAYSVLNMNGEWTEGTFKSYGTQDVNKVTLRLNSNTIKEVEATDNHRWILQNGIIKPTNELLEGDRIDFVSAPKPEIDDDYSDGVRHGLIYGDGTATKSHKRVKGYHIRLCGKSAEQLEWFDGYPVSYPETYNGDPIVMLYDGFGSVSKSSQVSLCVNDGGRKWLLDNSEKIGFVIQRVYKQKSETNYGKRKGESFVLFFSRSSITNDDLLCSWKRENFRELKSHYVVKSVERSRNTEVFCAEVDDTNTFVLENGLLTGNCSYLAIDNLKAFDEAMYVLMCGTGVGFSVEREETDKLPELAEEFYETDTTILVADSKIGWAKAYRELLSMLVNGQVPKWDVSKVRPEGAPLKTFGGRASGSKPLIDLFQYSVNTFRRFAGQKLPPIACHDLMCKVADIVVVGGVRRSALISLSDLNDPLIRTAKSPQSVIEYTLLDQLENGDRKYSVVVDDKPYGDRSLIVTLDDWASGELQANHKIEWYHVHPERALANNSISYVDKPDIGTFMKEWTALYESNSGERGIFNRVAAKKSAAVSGRRNTEYNFGTNPCSEIILRSKQFCNLSEVVVRSTDTFEDLKRKVKQAAILGTLQSTLTNFRYLSSIWKRNTEEERLLGVSLTGIMDHPVLSGSSNDWEKFDEEYTSGLFGKCSLPNYLELLKEVAIETNKEWAEKLGIPQSVAITAVKPSGTVSQLVDSASGIHPRYSDYYIRTVRQDKKDPLAELMVQAGFPCEDDVMKPDSTYVFSFPVKAPKGSVMRNDRSAIEQLELWKIYQESWCEHKPSITVYVKEDEWLKVGAWVNEHFDSISGVSFLPHSNHSYKQAPYQEITEEEYEQLLSEMPVDVDFAKLDEFEKEDTTVGMKEYACTGNTCELT